MNCAAIVVKKNIQAARMYGLNFVFSTYTGGIWNFVVSLHWRAKGSSWNSSIFLFKLFDKDNH
jgi:hypothetical protein